MTTDTSSIAPGSPGGNYAARFMSLFAGLDRSHGTYSVPADAVPDSEGKLRGNAVTVPTGPTLELWQAHLAGEKSLGVVPICSDSSCVFGALDIDSYIGFDLAALCQKVYHELNLPLVVCRSKSSGAHLFLFAAKPVSASLMRARLAECRDALGLPPKTEVFPKQERLTEANGSGGWLNMPFHGGEEPGPAYGGRYGLDVYGGMLTPDEFLEFAEAAKLEASWFEKPVAYMQAPGAGKKTKKQTKPEPAYKNGLEGAHYPELQSALAYYISVNGPPKVLSNGEIDLRIMTMLDTAGVTDLAKRREYIGELTRFGYKMRDEDQTKEPKKKGLLQSLCNDFVYFKAGSMEDGFVQFTNGDHKEVWPEERIENLLITRYLKLTNEAPKREELNAAMDCVKAQCINGPREEIHSRIARSPEKIYLDLCNDKWEAVEIDKDGWRIVSNPPVYFRRTGESRELPTPVPGGELEELRPLLNAGDDDQWILMMGWLVGAFQPEGAFSHIALEGQEGSAKTTTAINLIGVVDPNDAGLCGPPKNEEDFSIIAMTSGIIGYDNFSGCSAAMSDIFCRASTGSAYRTRTLYKAREVTSIKLKLPILFNGIDSVVMRGDLLRRTIVLNLPVIEKDARKTVKSLETKYREAHPRFLGALLDAVSVGLKNLSTTVVMNAPSMADFAQWVKACEPALPWEPGMFLTAYHSMQLGASEELFEKDQFAEALFSWAEPQLRKGEEFEKSSGELLKALNNTIHLEHRRMNSVDVKLWPTLQTINNHVKRVQPLLEKKGLKVTKTKRKNSTKGLWHFESTAGAKQLKIAA